MAKKIEKSPKLTGEELIKYHNANATRAESAAVLAAGAGYVSAKGTGSPSAYDRALLAALGMALPSKSAARTPRSKELNTVYTLKLQKTGNISIPSSLLDLLADEDGAVPTAINAICDGVKLTLTAVYTELSDSEDINDVSDALVEAEEAEEELAFA